MNKQFFQSIFMRDVGYVYKYLGVVPDGESRDHYITDEFANIAGSNSVSTMVTELVNYGITVIYYYSETPLGTNDKFELLTDLVPDPIPEPVEIILPESETAQEEQ